MLELIYRKAQVMPSESLFRTFRIRYLRISNPILMLLAYHSDDVNLKSATYWVSWDFACKTTKIHFIVYIPCITETS